MENQTNRAVSARLDKYGYLKFMDKLFSEKYEREGRKQLNIESYGLLCSAGYPYIDGRTPTIKRINGKIICTDYAGILKEYPVLSEIYEECERL